MVRTRTTLRRALLALAERMPFADISSAAVAEEAGVGYATFFRHYRDPRDLLGAVADDLIESLIAEIGTQAVVAPGEAAAYLVDFVFRHRAVCHALLVGGGSDMRAILADHAALRAKPIMNTKGHRFPADLILRHAVDAAMQILAFWLAHPDEMTEAAVADAICHFVFDPTNSA